MSIRRDFSGNFVGAFDRRVKLRRVRCYSCLWSRCDGGRICRPQVDATCFKMRFNAASDLFLGDTSEHFCVWRGRLGTKVTII